MVRDMFTMAWDLACRRYPAPVYGRRAGGQELPPIFCLHEPPMAQLEAMLRFLADSGYRGVTCDEYCDAQSRGTALDDKSVMLTFDDGQRRLWSYIYPLLKEYDFRATAFVMPGRIRHRDANERWPTLDDVRGGRASADELDVGWGHAQPLCTWEELAEMRDSGVIDVQCHTLGHHAVFADHRRIGFVSPEWRSRTHPSRLTPWSADDCAEAVSFPQPPLGVPRYRIEPRMKASQRYLDDPGLREACQSYVQAHGGEAFFHRDDWRERLDSVARAHTQTHGQNGRYESSDEVATAIRADLGQAREILREKLGDACARHLAFPWGVGSDLAVRIARETGYVSCFWGRVNRRLRNVGDGDPGYLARIGEDFLWSLRGAGRQPLSQVLTGKMMRRIRKPAPDNADRVANTSSGETEVHNQD